MECPHLAVSVKIQNNLRKENTDVTKKWHCAGKCGPNGPMEKCSSYVLRIVC